MKKIGYKGVTYSKDVKDNSSKSTKQSKHMPSQSIAVLSGGLQSLETLERFRNELRDVIWTEASVMDGKAGYRMYIWKHMAKNIWLPTILHLLHHLLLNIHIRDPQYFDLCSWWHH